MKTKKTHQVTLDFAAREPRQLRLDVMSHLGTYVASFVMSGDRINSLLAIEKKFVSGAASSANLRELIAVPIEPRAFMSLLFDRPLQDHGFKCQLNSSGFARKCDHERGRLSVVWQERTASRRIVGLRSPSGEIDLILNEVEAPIAMTERTFTLEMPNGFRRVDLDESPERSLE